MHNPGSEDDGVTPRKAVSSGPKSDKKGSERDRTWIADIRDLVGALAGVVAAVYVLGGAVVALRLFAARLPALTVVGGLPRESLIAVGLAQVLGLALATAAMIAGVLFSVDPDKPRYRHRRFSEKRRGWQVLHIAEAVVLTGVLLSPAVAAAVVGDPDPRLWGLLLGVGLVLAFAWTLLYLHLRARIRHKFEEDWRSERRVLLSAALVGALLLPNVVAFWSVQPLQIARVCTDQPNQPHTGVLVGETEKRLYVGEPRKVPRDQLRVLLSLPADQVKELYVGSGALEHICRGAASTEDPRISRPNARLWHGRVLVSLRLSRAARVTATLRRSGVTIRRYPFAGHEGLNRMRFGRRTGRPLPRGTYRLRLTARDGAGQRAVPLSVPVSS